MLRFLHRQSNARLEIELALLRRTKLLLEMKKMLDKQECVLREYRILFLRTEIILLQLRLMSLRQSRRRRASYACTLCTSCRRHHLALDRNGSNTVHSTPIMRSMLYALQHVRRGDRATAMPSFSSAGEKISDPTPSNIIMPVVSTNSNLKENTSENAAVRTASPASLPSIKQ